MLVCRNHVQFVNLFSGSVFLLNIIVGVLHTEEVEYIFNVIVKIHEAIKVDIRNGQSINI